MLALPDISIFAVIPQIHFHGKDMKNLKNMLGVECLPTRYGGKIDIPEGTGVILADLLQLYQKDFESEFFAAPASTNELKLNFFCSSLLPSLSVANTYGYTGNIWSHARDESVIFRDKSKVLVKQRDKLWKFYSDALAPNINLDNFRT